MPNVDPLAPLMADEAIAAAAHRAAAAIARVHRRPAGLRRFDVISSESLLRGARTCAALAGQPLAQLRPEDLGDGPLGGMVSAYSLLGPDTQAATVRTFARAPLQVLARLDVACGGQGLPADAPRGAAAQALARIITGGAGVGFDRLLPAVVHAEITSRGIFGPRSACVAFVAARAAAIHTGFDPRGFAVPETYLHRHAAQYRQAVVAYGTRPQELLVLLLQAWEAGAQEADGIARALR